MNEIKERMIKIISEQPEDSSFDEILCELSMNRMIQKGIDILGVYHAALDLKRHLRT